MHHCVSVVMIIIVKDEKKISNKKLIWWFLWINRIEMKRKNILYLFEYENDNHDHHRREPKNSFIFVWLFVCRIFFFIICRIFFLVFFRFDILQIPSHSTDQSTTHMEKTFFFQQQYHHDESIWGFWNMESDIPKKNT